MLISGSRLMLVATEFQLLSLVMFLAVYIISRVWGLSVCLS
jgi:hypothetical protein